MKYTEKEADQEEAEELDDEEFDTSERKRKQNRPAEKSSDPLYQRVTVYLPKPLYQRIRRRMANDNSRDLSQIITAGVIRELRATSSRKKRSEPDS